MTDIPLPAPGDTSWSDWAGEQEDLTDEVRNLGIVNVKDYGAVGNGTTDDSAAFAAAAAAAKAATHAVPQVGPGASTVLQYDNSGYVTITIPAGDYLITNPGAFLGDETMTSKALGLTWRGAGQFSTNIIFKPTSTGQAMLVNDYWLGLTFSDIGFFSATADCTWMRSYTTHNAQRYHFSSVRWAGFKYGFDLQGDNSNDSFTWIDCDSSATQNDGAFLYVGTSSTSDQFLNFSFYSQKHWSTSAPLIDAAKGGHFYVHNLDASDWGTALTGPGYLFRLRGAVHSLGVCTFKADGVRCEAKHADAGLIRSEWEQGNVSFNNVDWSSQSSTYTYNNLIYIDYQGVASGGPIYSFRDSNLAGTVTVKFATNDWQAGHIINFTNTTWRQKTSPSDVVVYDTTGNVNDLVFPPVDFINCRGLSSDVYSATGGTVWDARIGYRGQPLQSLRQRVVSVRGLYGIAYGGDTQTIVLPLGAMITGIQVMSPAGATAEGDGGTWTLATTDGSPVTIAAATVSGAMSAGFDVSTNLAVPFECSTAAKSKLTVKDTGVTLNNPKALFLIKGYW